MIFCNKFQKFCHSDHPLLINQGQTWVNPHSHRPRTNHGQTSATFWLMSKIGRRLAVIEHVMISGLTFSEPNLTDHGQMSANFCLVSKIGRRLAVVGTRHGKWTHLFCAQSHRPWTDVGKFLSPIKNRPTGTRHGKWTHLF